MWKGLLLEREIVRYPSVSLSPTLSKNEKVEQHIIKKTHKPNALRFWVEDDVIPLYIGSVLILCEIYLVLPLRITEQYCVFCSMLPLLMHRCEFIGGSHG